MTLEKYDQKRNIDHYFSKALCYLLVKQRTYYANVKENFITEVNVVSWLWDRPIKSTKYNVRFTQDRKLVILPLVYVKWNYDKKILRTFKCPNTGRILSDISKFWFANVWCYLYPWYCIQYFLMRDVYFAMVHYVYYFPLFSVVFFPFYCRTPMLSWSETWELK